MENIFEGAKFGDKFLTRDGRVAIYHRYETRHNLKLHVLFVENLDCCLYCENNGLHTGNHIDFPEWDDDIISRYQEPIDEESLEDLAESMSNGFWSDDLESFEDNPQRSLIIWAAKRIYECGIKNGYRKAKEYDNKDN